MIRRLFISCISLLIMACASKSDITNDPRTEVIERYFIGGFIQVTIEDGILEKITSQASAPVVGDTPNAKSNAAKVAEAKARLQIEKMRETLIVSNEEIQIESSSNEQSTEGNPTIASATAQKIITTVTQKINAVQKGVFVANERFDSATNTVTVTVQSEPKINEILLTY